MGFFSSFLKPFKAIGQKISSGASFLGKKALKGLDYTIQGAKILTDGLDKYSGGLSGFIPYYGALKAGVDIADHLRKMAKGEEKLNWTTGTDMLMSAGLGAIGAGSAATEIKGLKDGYNLFKNASSLGQGLRTGGSAILKGYGLHSDNLKASVAELGDGAVSLTKDLLKGKASGYGKLTGLIGAGIGINEVNKKIAQESNNSNTFKKSNIKTDLTMLTKPTNSVALPESHPLIRTFTNKSGSIVDKSGNIYG